MRRYAVTGWWTQWALRMLDAVGGRLRRPSTAAGTAAGEVRRLLLVRWERFGDLITLLPAVERAREAFPGVRITWMVAPAYADFVAGLGVVDEVWSVASWRRAIRERRRGFDLALEFHGDARWILVARRQARRVAGYGLRGGGFWLDLDVALPAGVSAATKNVRLVEAAAGARASGPFQYVQPRLRWARRSPAGEYVLIHPGCGQPSKRWGTAAWRELIAHCQWQGYEIVLAGGAQDRRLCAELAVVVAGPAAMACRDLSGRTSWSELAEWVAGAAAVVAPDTGIIHLAQALGTPTVALYGPTDPAIWGYSAAGHASLVHRLECSHCDHGVCPLVRRGEVSPCLQAITPGAVSPAVDRLMDALRRASSGPDAPPRSALVGRAPRF